MQVLHSLADVPRPDGKFRGVAIGNFDGIHLGHRTLLDKLVTDCRAEGLTPAVLTFYPHPVEVLRPGKRLERLTTTAEKLALLEELGVETVLVEKFDQDLAALDAEAFFARYLKDGLKARRIVVGFNFRFGRERAGDTAMLETLCRESGIALHVAPPFALGGERVSSTAIREKILEGDLEAAARLLGRPYLLAGTVERGQGRGRTLGFPTANLRFPADKILPKTGVYVTRVIWQKQAFASVTNVGVRPTVDASGSARVSVEVHLLGFRASLYDEELRVEFLERLRDERKFASLDELKAQIGRDVEIARAKLK